MNPEYRLSYTANEIDEKLGKIDILEEALANAGGGSGSTWRKIRTVTIPEDITSDTSGVAFEKKQDAGYIFAFDTDEEGKPFSVKELYMTFNAKAGLETHSYSSIVIKPISVPRTWGDGWSVMLNQTVAIKGTGFFPGHGSLRLVENLAVTAGALYVGGNMTAWTATARPPYVSYDVKSIEAISITSGDNNTSGYAAGSTFTFYGR